MKLLLVVVASPCGRLKVEPLLDVSCSLDLKNMGTEVGNDLGISPPYSCRRVEVVFDKWTVLVGCWRWDHYGNIIVGEPGVDCVGRCLRVVGSCVVLVVVFYIRCGRQSQRDGL